jgi:prepilin-type N-terminal cleavage/methylation domain-containing protein
MNWAKYKQPAPRGFTIVELLIVVVVIAILASITIVSYTGIQNRAHDSVVQGDIQNIAQKLNIYYLDKITYPATTDQPAVIAALDGLKVSRGSYVTSGTNVNLIYCTNAPVRDEFAVIGWSKSNAAKGFIITNASGVSTFNYPISSGSGVCTQAGVSGTPSWMWLYDVNSAGGWRPFI